ncbi:MAG TPA: hypothetical protein DDW52_17205 [Planctomycetaceae bacterium]|nr:hypothetical protein [Planctomycetaceae bacterium]
MPNMTKTQKRLASAFIVVQFAVLTLSLSANLSPSALQGDLLDWVEYYTIPTAQDYGAVPLELTHGESLDFPVAFQAIYADEPGAWVPLRLPGVAFGKERPIKWTNSRWPNLSRAVRLLYGDTGDPEPLAILAAALLKSEGEERPLRVRAVSPTVISFIQYQNVKEANLTVAEAFNDSVIYTADVVVLGDGRWSLVPVEESQRTARSELKRQEGQP